MSQHLHGRLRALLAKQIGPRAYKYTDAEMAQIARDARADYLRRIEQGWVRKHERSLQCRIVHYERDGRVLDAYVLDAPKHAPFATVLLFEPGGPERVSVLTERLHIKDTRRAA